MRGRKVGFTKPLSIGLAFACGLAGCGDGGQEPSERIRYGESVVARDWMVASGHRLATEAGLEILRRGGNAFDAGVATCMALNVVRPMSAGMVGVAPTVIYDARAGEVRGYSGVGTAPAVAEPSYYRSKGWPVAPLFGIHAQLLPACPDVWTSVLKEYGTMSFREVSEAAIRLAREGHLLNETVVGFLSMPRWERIGIGLIWPYNYSILFKPFGLQGAQVGDRFVQTDLARTLDLMVEAEAQEIARSGDRVRALESVRTVFYEGEIAEGIARMQIEEGGGITREDLAGFHGRWEEPVHGTFQGYTVWANQPWCQGPTVPMILQILEGMDLEALGHNSPAYISTLAQAVELAFADREAYFGDPDFVDVPIKGLLSAEYASERREHIDPHRAFGRMPPAGNPWAHEGRAGRARAALVGVSPVGAHHRARLKDTTYLCVVDSDGNALSLTPSDFPWSPMVPGYGLLLGNRMSQFHLKAGHPAQVAPGKRPRITPNPSMVTRGDGLFMAFGTPGGDQQPQAMVQVFLNIVVWGMDPQAAVDAPRFRSKNFPDSFSPHTYSPGGLEIEKALEDRAEALAGQGYEVDILPEEAAHEMGAVCAILKDESGRLIAGADRREESLALGD